MRISWSIISNALDRSRNILKGVSPLSISLQIWSISSTDANSVEWSFLKPHWLWYKSFLDFECSYSCSNTTVAYLGHGEKKAILLIRPGEILIHPGRLAIPPERITAYSARADYSIFRPGGIIFCPGGLLFRPGRLQFRPGGIATIPPGRIRQ